jgi:hypothetical protein
MGHQLIEQVELALGWSGPGSLGAGFAKGEISDRHLPERILTLARCLAWQAILREPGKPFTFLFTEQALRWPLCEPSAMADQITHIAALLDLPNITVSLCRWQAKEAVPRPGAGVLRQSWLGQARLAVADRV